MTYVRTILGSCHVAPVTDVCSRPAVVRPLHVRSLAGEAVDVYRRRLQQGIFGRRSMKGAAAHPTLLTSAGLVTERQIQRSKALFTGQRHTAVKATGTSIRTSSPLTANLSATWASTPWPT